MLSKKYCLCCRKHTDNIDSKKLIVTKWLDKLLNVLIV